MTVEEMLERMTAAEFMHWAEHFAGRSGGRQTAEEIRSNLRLAFASRSKGK